MFLIGVPEIVESWTGEDKPLGRGGQPVDVANAALWLASNDVGEALRIFEIISSKLLTLTRDE